MRPFEKDTPSPMRQCARVGLVLFASAFAPLSLTGCSLGPKAPPETPAPAAGALLPVESASVSADAEPEARWWESLGDPVLNDLVSRADAGNQTLAAAAANVRAAYAALGVTEGDLWPTIGLGAQYSRTQTNIAQLAAAGVRLDPYNMYAWGAGMSAWEIDLWGGVHKQVEAAAASAASQVDTLRDALLSVRGQVASTYVQLRTLQEQHRVLIENRDALAKTRDLVKGRFAAGTTNKLDLERAQAQLDAVEAQIPQVSAGIASATSMLAVLCGMDPAQLAPTVAAAKPIPAAPDVAGIGLPAQLLERRPDVRGAWQRLVAATAAIGAAEAMRLPTITVSGNFYIAANDVGGLGDLSNKAYSFGPSIYLPLFTGGKLENAVRQQRATADAALAQYRDSVLSAIGDVSACVSDFVYARETRMRSDAALASAQSALSLAQQQFDAGVTDYSVLIDVQRATLEAESTAVEARAGLVQGFISLQRALGAGWSDSDQIVSTAKSMEDGR
ncbi:MAG: Antibiotic efflux pump outer membrane protein ArpC [Planctomycetota bacterium]|jgi:NodT family efflux transporter outer membrane factor (OMF) lipoprotein